ncbi:MAG: T9SS type A sorting domain-containing protein [Bacteroidota bacterium]
MPRFATLLLLLAFAPAALAQSFSDSGVTLAPFADAADRPVETLLENFDKTAAIFQLNTVQDGDGNVGFTFGTSPFDFQIGEAFDRPAGEVAVLGADLYFANVGGRPTSTTYTVEVWTGDETSGPISELGSEAFDIADIQFDGSTPVATEVRFSTPVMLPDNGDTQFFLVFPFDQNLEADSLALGTTGQLAPELVVNKTWHFFGGTWRTTNSLITSGGVPLETWVWADAFVDVIPVASEALPAGVTVARAFPNPLHSGGTVELDLAEASGARVSVVDALGRDVLLVHEGTLPAGRTSFAINTATLTPALYLVRFEVDGGVVTRPLSVVR